MDELPPEACVNSLLQQADRLGVEVRWLPASDPQMPQGLYQANPDRPGVIELRTGTSPVPSPALCQLLSHEMVHVLQHWHADFKAVLPLGWPQDGPITQERKLSAHEAEAFTAQDKPQIVLQALKQLVPVSSQTNSTSK